MLNALHSSARRSRFRPEANPAAGQARTTDWESADEPHADTRPAGFDGQAGMLPK